MPKRGGRGRGVEPSSGNVFADLAVPSADEALARAKLAQRIGNIISSQKLTQARAAAILGVDQPKVSALIRGRLAGFSTDRLLRFLNALGQDIEIVIREKARRNSPARVRVIATGR